MENNNQNPDNMHLRDNIDKVQNDTVIKSELLAALSVMEKMVEKIELGNRHRVYNIGAETAMIYAGAQIEEMKEKSFRTLVDFTHETTTEVFKDFNPREYGLQKLQSHKVEFANPGYAEIVADVTKKEQEQTVAPQAQVDSSLKEIVSQITNKIGKETAYKSDDNSLAQGHVLAVSYFLAGSIADFLESKKNKMSENFHESQQMEEKIGKLSADRFHHENDINYPPLTEKMEQALAAPTKNLSVSEYLEKFGDMKVEDFITSVSKLTESLHNSPSVNNDYYKRMLTDFKQSAANDAKVDGAIKQAEKSDTRQQVADILKATGHKAPEKEVLVDAKPDDQRGSDQKQ